MKLTPEEAAMLQGDELGREVAQDVGDVAYRRLQA